MNNEGDRQTSKASDHDDKALSALYQHTRQVEPPNDLDETILGASRREVHARPRPASPFSGRWQVPASIAAVLVVTIILVPLMVSDPEMQQETQESMPMLQKEEPIDEYSTESVDAPAPPTTGAPSELLRLHRDSTLSGTTGRLKNKETIVEQRGPAILRVQSSDQPETDDSAEAWLEHIRELAEQGDKMAAVQQLEAFRKAWPDYPIDPELEKQLGLPAKPGLP